MGPLGNGQNVWLVTKKESEKVIGGVICEYVGLGGGRAGAEKGSICKGSTTEMAPPLAPAVGG